MKNIVWFAMLVLAACGGGSSNPNPSPVVAGSQSPSDAPTGYVPPTPIPACSTILKCQVQCGIDFPTTTTEAIEAKCAAEGLLESAGCQQQIAANNVAISNYNHCLTVPVNQVVSYP